MSEQQFAASLEAEAEKPQFVVEDLEAEAVLAEPPAEAVVEAQTAEPPVAQPKDDEPAAAGVVSDVAGREPGPPSPSEVDWRSLVSAKVSRYKARKPQEERYPSLKLPFDPPSQRAVREPEAMHFQPDQEVSQEGATGISREEIFTAPTPEPPRIVLEATARVLEFPRPVARADELAEPMIDRPRIVEAPELLPPPPAMGGILIEEQREPEPERRPGFDVPLQSASLNRRIGAGVFDTVLVAGAVTLFGYVFIRMNGTLPPLRSAVVVALSLVAVFWSAYQYAFLVYSGKTPGLWAARVHLSRFDGHRVPRRQRRWRALASMLSLVSLGLGYVWCFFDEDQLSWHDRITKTHLAPNQERSFLHVC